MTGPGAAFSLFSKKLNVVLVMNPIDNLGKHEHEKAVRVAGIKAAHYLAQAGTSTTFDEEIRYPVTAFLRTREGLSGSSKGDLRRYGYCPGIAS